MTTNRKTAEGIVRPWSTDETGCLVHVNADDITNAIEATLDEKDAKLDIATAALREAREATGQPPEFKGMPDGAIGITTAALAKIGADDE